MKKEKIQSICETLNKVGKRLTVDAEEYLMNFSSVHKIDDSALLKILLTKYKDDLFITKDILENIFKQILQEKRERSVLEEKYTHIKYDLNILVNLGDSLKKISGVFDIVKYLLSRYEKIGKEILRDYGIRETINISKISSVGGEYYILGIIVNKKISHDINYLELEDLTGRKKFILPRDNEHLKKLISMIPLDSIIAAKIFARRNKLPLLLEIYLPKIIPERNRSNDDVFVIFTSDLHVGSKEFEYDAFERFIEIVKGQVDDEKIKEISGKIQYLIIAGDLVDGIGVYPKQKEDLLIEDIYEQYTEAYRLLTKLPNRIKIIISPGNHDATTKSIPRPPIYREYAEKLYKDPRFLLVSDPVNLNLHGVNIFVFHGDFINDIFSTSPGLSHSNVSDAMDILLSIRHIAPTYGLQTRIIPQDDDPLIIPKNINILHGGHIHIFGYRYRYGNNLLILNSGTWQSQTEYQREMGMTPTPGIIPIVNLKTLKLHVLKLS